MRETRVLVSYAADYCCVLRTERLNGIRLCRVDSLWCASSDQMNHGLCVFMPVGSHYVICYMRHKVY